METKRTRWMGEYFWVVMQLSQTKTWLQNKSNAPENLNTIKYLLYLKVFVLFSKDSSNKGDPAAHRGLLDPL